MNNNPPTRIYPAAGSNPKIWSSLLTANGLIAGFLFNVTLNEASDGLSVGL